MGAETMTAIRPVTEMTDAELLAELNAAFGLSVAILERGAALWAEANRRGLSVKLRSVLMASFLPRIADNTLAAAAVLAFADLPRLLEAVATLPVSVQVELAAGRLMIDTVMVVGEEPVPLHPRDLCPSYVTTDIIAGKIATVEQQTAALITVRKREERKTQMLVEKLARRMEREGNVTPRRAVEIAVALGWGPKREWPAP